MAPSDSESRLLRAKCSNKGGRPEEALIDANAVLDKGKRDEDVVQMIP